jgi:enamine deaminase RidA (YjgF/YER057c/UK114 family)
MEVAMVITRHGIGQLISQVVEHGDTVYVQGMTADDKTANIQEQTRQVLAKIDRALAAAGTDKSHLLSAHIFVSDIALRPQLNEVWTAWIDPGNPPIRACVGVQLEGSTRVEIVVVAAKRKVIT